MHLGSGNAVLLMLMLMLLCGSCWATAGFVPDLGPYKFEVSTASEAAAVAFNKGWNHCFNFNQPLARQAFSECAAADPSCPMCHFGMAHAYGPFLNGPKKSPSDLQEARKAAVMAAKVLNKHGNATAKEAGLIAAMVLRFPDEPRSEIPIDTYTAFEVALENLHQYLGEEDMDVAVLLAEAKMDLQSDEDGYHFFDDKGRWTKRSQQAAALLLKAIDSSPTGRPHPMAAHLLIHLTEGGKPSFTPGEGAAKGLEAAEALLESYAASQANHLQHMPAHTLMRTGRYAEAVKASRLATASDWAYLSNGTVPYGPGHNLAAGIIAASMSGMSAAASTFGEQIRATFAAAPDRPDGPGGSKAWNLPVTTPLRLGLWEDALRDADMGAAPPFPRKWPYAEVLRSYAKGSALLALGCLEGGRKELRHLKAAVEEVRESEGESSRLFQLSDGVALRVLGAAFDLRAKGDAAAALKKLKAAADVQSSFGYEEPPSWHQPLKDCVGQVLLDAGRFKEAEAAFRSSLTDYPESPYALWGLRESLMGGGKEDEAEQADLRARIAAAWSSADVALVGSCPALMMSVAPPTRATSGCIDDGLLAVPMEGMRIEAEAIRRSPDADVV